MGTVGCGGASAVTSGPAGSTTTAGSAPAEATGSKVAYDCGDTSDICVMNPDGTGGCGDWPLTPPTMRIRAGRRMDATSRLPRREVAVALPETRSMS